MKTARTMICIALIAILTLTSVCALADGVKLGKATSDRTLVCNKSFSEMIDCLQRGTRVIYWECGSENLVRIITQTGVTGYCYRGYISEVEDLDEGSVCKTKGDATLYGRKKNGKMVKKKSIKSGLPVIVVKTKGEWAKVKNLKGRTAFMKIADLKKAF